MGLDLSNMIPCELRKHGICTFMLEKLTLPMMGTPAVCNYFCPSLDGPQSPSFNGDAEKFLEAMIRRGTGNLFRKVLDRGPQEFYIPKLSDEFWRQVNEIADAYQATLNLAGSAICKGLEPKDIDVLLGFDEIDNRAVDALNNLKGKRTEIDGYQVDWSIIKHGDTPLFPLIDIEAKTLRASVWFVVEGSSVDDLEVEIAEHPLDHLMPQLLELSQGCDCGGSS